MPLNHKISMEDKPAVGLRARTHTPMVFYQMGTWPCNTVQRQLQMGRNGREFRDSRERDAFEKAEGYKNRTWLGSWPGLTQSFLHSKLTLFEHTQSHPPACPCPSGVTTLPSVCLCGTEKSSLFSSCSHTSVNAGEWLLPAEAKYVICCDDRRRCRMLGTRKAVC